MGYRSCKIRHFLWLVEQSNDINVYVCPSASVDLTENSVEVCQQRYQDRANRFCYNAEFFPLDCTKVCLSILLNYLHSYKFQSSGTSSR